MFCHLTIDLEKSTRDSEKCKDEVREILEAHPFVLALLLEKAWGKRGGPVEAWPEPLIDNLLGFWAKKPRYLDALGKVPRGYHHLIYAYFIERTGIVEVFRKGLALYRAGALPCPPSAASQKFWRNAESLMCSGSLPTTIASIPACDGADEPALRWSAYQRLFGSDLAADVAQKRTYPRAATANERFSDVVAEFLNELTIARAHRHNTCGADPTNEAAIARSAANISAMMCDRRSDGILLGTEFRAVAMMSWLHLAVSFDSSVVVDLCATGCTAFDRCTRMARSVGAEAPPPSAAACFDIACPFAYLLNMIETGEFHDPLCVPLLYEHPKYGAIAEEVGSLYPLATGRDLAARPAPYGAPLPELAPVIRLVSRAPAAQATVGGR